MKFALTRDISPAINQCELTHLDRAPIDLARAREQHDAYCGLLSELAWTVIRLPTSIDLPDSVFVEDTAVVTNEVAILTKPGAASRLAELPPVLDVLANFCEMEFVLPPATLDGGDVLTVGKNVWVGVGDRTNQQGFESLRNYLQPHGYTVRSAQTKGCLHLKTAVNRAASDCLIVNPNWIDPRIFSEWKVIEIDPSEPFAANVLWLGEVTLVSKSYPKSRDRLESHGVLCRTIDMSELAKAEGGLTCCSILFDA
ncbi:MAG: dimethylargininase [Planctomycetes bacterium]|nr:dimethylargininase [Planctomycetota bacterium]MBI3833537.1 dimethylargininase [Planctomycetota bacterium]